MQDIQVLIKLSKVLRVNLEFVKNFSMPLSSSTKMSIAREVCSQINELNNYVSKISENAKPTNGYMMKD